MMTIVHNCSPLSHWIQRGVPGEGGGGWVLAAFVLLLGRLLNLAPLTRDRPFDLRLAVYLGNPVACAYRSIVGLCVCVCV